MSEPKAKEVKAKEAPKEVKHHAPQPKVEKVHQLKLTQMNLDQVNQALEQARQQMGSVHSKYAQFLLARRDYLSRIPAASYKKAA